MMKSYLEWHKSNPFYIKETWDDEKKCMVGAGALKLFPIQERILGKIFTPVEEGRFPYETILYSTPKKQAKTIISASVAVWYADCADPGKEIYVIANSQEQATGRVFGDVVYHYRRFNEQMERDGTEDRKVKITQYRVTLPNDTFIQVLTNSYVSSAGSRHSLTLFDEIWGIKTEADYRLWDEMTPIPTVSYSLRFITTYAGFINESTTLWDLYSKNVGPEEYKDGAGQSVKGMEDLPCWEHKRFFTFWTHEPFAPWVSQDYYDTQLLTTRPATYLRLHENRWVTSREEFIPVGYWDDAMKAYPKSAEGWADHPYHDYPVIVGIDAAVKRDCMAIVGVTYDFNAGHVVQLFHRIWKPSPDDFIDVDETVLDYIMEKAREFKIRCICYDPRDMSSTVVKLNARGFVTKEIVQAPSIMSKASQALFDVLMNHSMKSYPSEETRQHIQNTVAVSEAKGFRITKERERGTKLTTKKPMDFTVALAMAVWEAKNQMAVVREVPIVIRSPFSDVSRPYDESQRLLPVELRG